MVSFLDKVLSHGRLYTHLHSPFFLPSFLPTGLVLIFTPLCWLVPREKLLEHLKHWNDADKIIGSGKWPRGQEPDVAAAIMDLFTLLPSSPHFLGPLFQVCQDMCAVTGAVGSIGLACREVWTRSPTWAPRSEYSVNSTTLCCGYMPVAAARVAAAAAVE